jgi:cellulose biosynthesis protein BcsQ
VKGIIVSPTYFEEFNTIKGIFFSKVDDFYKEEDVYNTFTAAEHINLSHLLIDFTAFDKMDSLDSVIMALDKFRIKNDKAQIIIFAPGREPGDKYLAQVTIMGIHDIIAPSYLYTDESNQDNPVISNVASLIQGKINSPATYGEARRWQTSFSMDTKDQKEEKSFFNFNFTKSNEEKHKEPIVKEKIVEVIKERFIGKPIIAIAGSKQGVGTTYIAIQIAAYLKQFAKETKKVALVELLDESISTKSFTYLETEDKDQSGKGFIEQGIAFYPVETLNFTEVLAGEFDFIVLDMGILFQSKENKVVISKHIEEFFRSNLSLLIGNIKEWNIQYLTSSIQKLLELNQNKTFDVVFNLSDYQGYDKELFDYFFSQSNKRFNTVTLSYSPDPYKLTDKQKESYQQLLQVLLPQDKKKKSLLSLFKK